ncbi:hypothetical protein F5144DRAFT_561465 [Chaetomium tenue]|uniref:Uncharacterized protein n=1 Tax=Chaetomium tenue TaxID=1854479 RepID=A0ACB7PG14_9PEZI|nr:hypothetical protein F5144DRAFT_561465 [Chaetomium globosum]
MIIISCLMLCCVGLFWSWSERYLGLFGCLLVWEKENGRKEERGRLGCQSVGLPWGSTSVVHPPCVVLSLRTN